MTAGEVRAVTPENRVRLSGYLVEKDALRRTPAGIPVIKAVFHHHSELVEAGSKRSVELYCPLNAVGEAATWIAAAPLGVVADIEGFLAARRQGSPSMVLHVQTFTIREES